MLRNEPNPPNRTEPTTLGNGNRLITLDDLEAIHEPVAALLLELPQREIGGLLPALEAR